MNCRQSEEPFVMFREYMKLLPGDNEGFEYELFLDSSVTCTGCLEHTSIACDGFYRLGVFVSIGAMRRGLKNSYRHM